jgi:hypothetical protein
MFMVFFSFIKPGEGTGSNENLHKLLKRYLIGRPTISPQTMIALICTYIVHYNIRRQSSDQSIWKHSIQISGHELLKPRTGMVQSDIQPSKRGTDECTSDDNNFVHTMSRVKRLKTCADSMCLTSRVVDSAMVLLHSQYSMLPNCEEHEEPDTHSQTLAQVVGSFGLELVPVEKDGNCLFSAVCNQLKHFGESSGEQFRAHLQKLDICHDEEFRPARLREAVLNEMEKNQDRYIPFLDENTAATYPSQVAKFRQSGQFATDFGDLIPIAIANVLGSVLILLSSDPLLPYQSVTPERNIIPNVPMYLAFNCSGAGHYDGTRQKSALPTVQCVEKILKCRCGINSKALKGEQSFCKTSRCPCKKEGRECSLCSCYNCQNSSGFVKVQQTRKSDNRLSKLHRLKGADYMKMIGITSRGDKWSLKEDLLLAEIAKTEQTITQIVDLYNQTLKEEKKEAVSRSKGQIVSRLSHFKKMKRQ